MVKIKYGKDKKTQNN